MKMGSVDQTGTLEPKGEINTCPACGYTDGFHVAFDFSDAAAGNEARGEIYLICPSCRKRYRPGWKVIWEAV